MQVYSSWVFFEILKLSLTINEKEISYCEVKIINHFKKQFCTLVYYFSDPHCH